MGVPVIGIAGWKNSGKTTLAVRLIAEFARRGLDVASVKHAHHAFQVDDGDTDSARHRRAGARAIAIVGAERIAVIRELHGAPEPSLDDVLASLGAADIVVVEGYKRAPIAKIEVRAPAGSTRGGPPLAPADPHVVAIATDDAPAGDTVPHFRRDAIAEIADFVLLAGGLLPADPRGAGA